MPAWDNRFRKLSFGIGILLLILFAGSGVLLIFFQSSPGKSFLASYLSKALQEEKGYSLTVGRIEGSLPYEIVLYDVVIESENDLVEAKMLDAKLSLLPLLKREISFLQLKGEDVRWTRKKESLPNFDFPYAFSISKLQLSNVTLPNGAVVDLIGSLRLGKKSAARLKISQGEALATIYANIKDQELQLRGNVKSSSFTALKPWIDVEESGSVEASASLKGPLNVLLGKEGVLQGKLNLTTQIEESKRSQLIGKWKLLSSFEMTAEEFRCFNAQLKGSELLAQGSLGFARPLQNSGVRQKNLQSASIRFGLSGLDKLDFAPVSGAISGQLFLQGNLLNITCVARTLAWDGFEVKQIRAGTELAKTENGWKRGI